MPNEWVGRLKHTACICWQIAKVESFYTGVSGELKIRIWKHKTKFYPDSFTSKYNVTKLVYFESFRNPSTAIKREKQIKGGSRIKKIALIEKDNPDWLDLAETWF